MFEWSNKLINQWKSGWVSLSKKSTNRQLTITTGDYRRPSPVQLAFAFPGSHKLVARFAVIYHNLSISKFWSKALPVWRQSRISAADNYRNFLQLYFLKMQLESLIYESKTTNSWNLSNEPIEGSLIRHDQINLKFWPRMPILIMKDTLQFLKLIDEVFRLGKVVTIFRFPGSNS